MNAQPTTKTKSCPGAKVHIWSAIRDTPRRLIEMYVSVAIGAATGAVIGAVMGDMVGGLTVGFFASVAATTFHRRATLRC